MPGKLLSAEQQVHRHDQTDQQIVQEHQYLPHAAAHAGDDAHHAGDIGRKSVVRPVLQIGIHSVVNGVEQGHQLLILPEGRHRPGVQLGDFVGKAEPQGLNAGKQLGGDHDDQGVHDQKPRDHAEAHRQTVGQLFQLFRQMLLKQSLIEIAHWPQQIRHNAAVGKGCKDAPQLVQRVAHAPKTVNHKKQHDTQTDTAEYGQHQIYIPPLDRVLHVSTPKELYGKYTSIRPFQYE